MKKISIILLLFMALQFMFVLYGVLRVLRDDSTEVKPEKNSEIHIGLDSQIQESLDGNDPGNTQVMKQCSFEQFIQQHIQEVNSKFQSQMDQFVFEKRNTVSKKIIFTRNELNECFVSVRNDHLPSFIDHVYQHCDQKESLHGFTTSENISRYIYCIGKLKGVKSFLDVFASYGGASAIMATSFQQKILSNPESEKDVFFKLIGLEREKKACELSRKYLRDFKFAEMLCGETMPNYLYNNMSNTLSISKSVNIIQLCLSEYKEDLDIVIVGGNQIPSKTSLWIDDQNNIRFGAEFYASIHYCKPKFVVLTDLSLNKATSTSLHDEFYRFLDELSGHYLGYQLLIEGVSSRSGCEWESQKRRWAIFMR